MEGGREGGKRDDGWTGFVLRYSSLMMSAKL